MSEETHMVSIIMSAYNRAATLPRAVRSVLSQTHGDWELIIVDDGSTDATPTVLAGLVDPRIRVYSHPQNRGVTAAKNTGLDHIGGEWFTTLDSDDEITPDALAVMLDCAGQTGADAITCNCLDSTTGRLTGSGPQTDGWLTPEETARCRGEFWGLTQTTLLGNLRFSERLPGYEDTLWLMINRRARRYYLHKALRIYHTEGVDRVTKSGSAAGLLRKVEVFTALGRERSYLRELKRVDPSGYRHTMTRVRAARVLSPFLRLAPSLRSTRDG